MFIKTCSWILKSCVFSIKSKPVSPIPTNFGLLINVWILFSNFSKSKFLASPGKIEYEK